MTLRKIVAKHLTLKTALHILNVNLFVANTGEFNRAKLDGTETPVRVKRIVRHPGYGTAFAHNIALLELEKPVKLNDHIRMVSSVDSIEHVFELFLLTCLFVSV